MTWSRCMGYVVSPEVQGDTDLPVWLSYVGDDIEDEAGSMIIANVLRLSVERYRLLMSLSFMLSLSLMIIANVLKLNVLRLERYRLLGPARKIGVLWALNKGFAAYFKNRRASRRTMGDIETGFARTKAVWSLDNDIEDWATSMILATAMRFERFKLLGVARKLGLLLAANEGLEQTCQECMVWNYHARSA